MVSGRTSTRGSASSMKWTAAELLDTVARRGVDGGRGYGEGVAAMASAMAWEREGEELGANGGVQEGRGATWSSSRPSGRREGEAGRRAAAWRAAVPPPSTLAACLASQAARWSGGRAGPARWAGWWACGGAR